MEACPKLLTSVNCGRCKTHLVKSSKEKHIRKYFCQCRLKVRALLICNYCKKEFLNLPYLIRKTNYCSRQCYWSGTNKRKKRKCKACGRVFYASAHLIKKGFGFYCSRQCWFNLFKKWKIKVECKECGKQFLVLRSVYKKKPRFCSKKCKDDFERDYVGRVCKKCKRKFELPRSDVNRGRGSFCSWDCHRRFNGETSIEKAIRLELQKLGESFIQEAKFERYRVDFLLPKRKLVIECDGEYWHRFPEKKASDLRKDRFLTKKGYQVIRLKEEEIRKEAFSLLKFLIY